MPNIDAHHHLWRYTPDEFDWLEGSLTPLRRDFLLPDLEAALASAKVDGTVAVQARQSLEETRWLLSLAEQTTAIQGVVGWAPLADPAFPDLLPELTANPRLKGLRHVVQGEPDPEFLLGTHFNRGIRALAAAGLTYDLLIYAHQLPAAIRFVDLHPNQPFVLDHIAKPRIAAGELQPWATHLRDLARRPHVCCKPSGMVTEAGPDWTPAQLTPYLDIVTEAFTPARLLAGSDWPVCLPAVSYADWFDLLRGHFAHHTPTEQAAIFGDNATSFYHLD